MSHSYVRLLYHVVFSTKERQHLIPPDLQERLFPYLAGIATHNGFTALAVGGVVDHVHVVPQLPSTLTVAKAVQLRKGNSSGWVHETFPQHDGFVWQEGCGAFSIGARNSIEPRPTSAINPGIIAPPASRTSTSASSKAMA